MKRNASLALALLIFVACSSQKDNILTHEEQDANTAKTKNCLEHPELAAAWGECNVRKVIYEKVPKIRACYEKEKDKNYDKSGDLLLKIHVRSNGRVRDVQIAEGSLKNKMIAGCLLKELQKARFARPPVNLQPVIYFPFSFSDLVNAQ